MLLTHLIFVLTLGLPSSPESSWQEGDDARAIARGMPLPELTLAELPRWRAHVRPSAEEVGYEAIPWLSEFAEGVRKSSEEGKPLLFWAMNGHPLGCT